jgi:hypothetical protein
MVTTMDNFYIFYFVLVIYYFPKKISIIEIGLSTYLIFNYFFFLNELDRNLSIFQKKKIIYTT